MQILDIFEYGSIPIPAGMDISGLDFFLNKIWKNRRILSTKDEEDNTKQQLLEVKKNRLKAKNYVGIIQYEGTQINIIPKIFRPAKNSKASEKDRDNFIDHLFFWLTYCEKIHFPFSKNLLKFDKPKNNYLFEILIRIFASYTEEKLIEQPYNQYQNIVEETPYLKGNLSINKYVQENLSTGRWHYFQSNHQPFIYDNIFNRIIKYTSKQLLNLTQDKKTRTQLESILFTLDEVSDQVCRAEDCEKVQLNSMYEELGLIADMCRMFLDGLAPSIQTGERTNFCFLLPMEYIFEDFIYGFLKTHFSEWGFKNQVSDLHLASSEEHQKIFQLRHDIYSHKHKILIDTKYKIRDIEGQPKKRGVKQSDMYQMLAYAVRRKELKSIYLLYPNAPHQNAEKPSTFSIDSPLFPDKSIEIKALNLDICLKNSPNFKELEANLKKSIASIL